MANGKEYAVREMIYDQCFSTGREYTREELMKIVNRELKDRGKNTINSRTTFMQDIMEMNEKFFHLYGKYGIVWEDRNKKRYYRYRGGIDSIYNRELTQEEVGKLQEVRNLLQGFKGMPDFGWIDQMMTRLDQTVIGNKKTVASFEGKEPLLFSFNYIHEDKNDWKDVHFRICLGPKILDATMTDYQNDWGYIRTCLERIVNHSRTVIELYDGDEPTKIELKKAGEMLDIKVTPNRYASKDEIPFSGWARCKDVVRELYLGLLECAKAFPKDYVDGCPFTYDVVYNEMKSEVIEDCLKEEKK